MSTSVIELKELTKYYGKHLGINKVSITVDEGEVFGFIGPNGAGKSTTIRTLLNFLFPTSGTGTIFGLDIVKDHVKIKENIGYVPSEVYYYDDLKVNEMIDYAATYHRGVRQGRIRELMHRLDLNEDKKISELSYGNKKKVAIVQALMHEPKLLILDEPTNGLDPLIQQTFYELLHEENKKGATIFFSSHHLDEVQKLCHRVAIIKDGEIMKVGSIDELKEGTYKKIRFESDFNDISLLELKHVKSVSRQGNITSFTYHGDSESLLRLLSGLPIKNIWIEDPSLEELFMKYYQKEEK